MSSPSLVFAPVFISLLNYCNESIWSPSICSSLWPHYNCKEMEHSKFRDITQHKASVMLLSKKYHLNWEHAMPNVHIKVFPRSVRFFTYLVSRITECHKSPGKHHLTPSLLWRMTKGLFRVQIDLCLPFCLFRD